KKRGQAPERAKAIQAEVQKLVAAGIIREVYYYDWLSNPVMVKKHDGSWRMCVDFTDLNKAYAYKGYHQIQMAESDEEKTAFHTSQGVYCYTKMPFGLKNAGATYQRLVDRAFDSQVGRNMEVYVDDLVIKSHTEAEMLRDIGETFRTGKVLAAIQNLEEMHQKSDFHWTPEAEQAFKKLKHHLSELSLLVAPKLNEELIVYMSASYRAVSAVLMTERGTVQTPVYFISRALQGEHIITYRPRTSVKGQILADFLVEKPDENPPNTPVVANPLEPWTLFTDGSLCVDGSAEYEALIAGLRIAAQMGMQNVQVNVDSKLVANQVLGTYVAKEENMIKYLEKVKGLEVTTVVEEDGPTWMTPIMEYLKDGTLPDDRKEASKLRIKARQYELMEGTLYRRSFLKSWLRCVGPLQVSYVIREIHEGLCSMHARPRSVVAKAMRLGYYWSTMHRDARDMIACNDCQVHCSVPRNLQQPLTPITAPWPFYKWGIDIAGPFLEGPGIKAHLGEGNKNWLEELPHVLWAHRTMIKSSHRDTPFSLTYGTEVVIPAEIGMPTYRTTTVDTVHNDEELRLNLDLLEEKRERAAFCEAKSKMKMTKYYNARVRGVAFRPGDFVYRSNDASHAAAEGKLGPNREGPYEVTEALGDEAYKLRTMDDTDLPRT
ncbi:reverse transcriptase domain-containing protein, partial [Tanacetum coccineum]